MKMYISMNKRKNYLRSFMITVLAAVMLLSGCSDSEYDEPIDIVIGEKTEHTEHTDKTSVYTTDEPHDLTNPPIVTESPAPVETDEPKETEAVTRDEKAELEQAVDRFPYDSFPAPDGSVIKKEEAVSGVIGDGGFFDLEYDGAFICYASPIYLDTDSEPALYDFAADKWNSDIMSKIYEPLGNCIKVKKGDVLDNGLTVTEACFSKNSNEGSWFLFDSFSYSVVVFEGSLTLEGVLYRIPEHEYGRGDENDVEFYPNPIKSQYIPCLVTDIDEVGGKELVNDFTGIVDKNNKFAFKSCINQRSCFNLGNVYDIDSLSEYLSKGECLKVTVTVTDISLRKSNFNPDWRSRAALVEYKINP